MGYALIHHPLNSCESSSWENLTLQRNKNNQTLEVLVLSAFPPQRGLTAPSSSSPEPQSHPALGTAASVTIDHLERSLCDTQGVTDAHSRPPRSHNETLTSRVNVTVTEQKWVWHLSLLLQPPSWNSRVTLGKNDPEKFATVFNK